MGYYGNGFVLTDPPRWDALDGFSADVGFAGYRHKDLPVWLLDAWTCTRRGAHWPFTDELVEEGIVVPGLATEANELLGTFNRICEAVRKEPFDEIIYGAGLLRLTAHLSTILAPQVFFFAADDELTDMAVQAAEGRLARFRVRFGVWAIAYQGAGFIATPRLSSEDEEIRFSESVAHEISQIPNVAVAEPEDTSGGDPLYASAVSLWPPAAGDPVRILGVGTWDPFENLERDFDEVFARKCPQPAAPTRSVPATVAAPPKPWWKIW
jgi:hypothetical protein